MHCFAVSAQNLLLTRHVHLILHITWQTSIADIMDPALEHVQRARRLIADLEAPAQPQLQSPSRARNPDCGLNEDQELAVDRFVRACVRACVFEATFATKT